MNWDVNCQIGYIVLGNTAKVKDLRITICADIKVAEHGGIASSKGNQTPGLITRKITYNGKKAKYTSV